MAHVNTSSRSQISASISDVGEVLIRPSLLHPYARWSRSKADATLGSGPNPDACRLPCVSVAAAKLAPREVTRVLLRYSHYAVLLQIIEYRRHGTRCVCIIANEQKPTSVHLAVANP